ncbi:hypothetical protein [Mycobacterium sp. 1164985.4]|uniref:PPE domain-containing protein n=1 Tax=Mycobacterium sp. 1164985.4 TaxID=1834069 RepID=UPI0008025505|nr:hypothetical protein [Mycobacterium sp. 1164985.4]OBK76376.1 hypothetical protein A5650_15775 [Mycobacterium sp. 1164985.4]
MGEIQRVEPAELTKQSAEMHGTQWHSPVAEAVVPPDALPSSAAAVANLNANAQSLLEFQRWAETENQRVAEMLQIAADAYTEVDETCGRAIENPNRRAAVDAIAVPAPATPPPALPHPVGTPQPLDAAGYSDVHETQADLVAGDNGASLKMAMLQWGLASNRARDAAPRPPSGDWEGRAADAAYARMAEFSGWLEQLAEGWHDLAEAAAKIIAAHDAAKAEHAGIHTEYAALETQLRELAARATVGNSVATSNDMAKIQRRMQELQQQSDDVRQDYASGATFSPVRPAMPSGPDADSAAVVGGPGGTESQPGGGRAGVPLYGPQPSGIADRTVGAGRSGGARAGGRAPAGGGAPTGGGAPSGGAAPAGGSAPAGASTSGPKSTEPHVRPAAVGGAAAGGGRGGGAAGGGGMPATPMSAPVTAETVAPAPTVPAAAGAAPGSSTEGRAGTTMAGGMAPMAHGAGAQHGKEKRRDPRVAPDEDLYTEDRPWTEAVVGIRRRRAVADGESRDDT